jgi:hypothetical protein
VLVLLAVAIHQQVEKGSPGVEFAIFDELSPELIAFGQSEQAGIKIDGRPIGTLTVNEHFPSATLNTAVQNEGQHSFAIEASAVISHAGQPVEVNCYGTGMLDVRQGSRFSFEARYDGTGPCVAWLEKQ